MKIEKRLKSLAASLDKATDEVAGGPTFPILMLAHEAVQAALAVVRDEDYAERDVFRLRELAERTISSTLGRMAE
jgi:hypothetical protein